MFKIYIPGVFEGDAITEAQGLFLILHSGITPGGVQRTIGMPGIRPGLAAFKAISLPVLISLQPYHMYFYVTASNL